MIESAGKDCPHFHGPTPKKNYEKAPQGCCGMESLEPGPAADSGECGRLSLQHLVAFPIQKTISGIINHETKGFSTAPQSLPALSACVLLRAGIDHIQYFSRHLMDR